MHRLADSQTGGRLLLAGGSNLTVCTRRAGVTTASSRDVPAVYVSNAVDEASPRWRFFLTTHGRMDLWPRTQFFSRQNLDVAAVPAGSLLVLYPFEPQLADLVGPDKCCAIVHRVTAIGGA